MSTWRNTADHYGRLAMLMHWGVLLLIVGVYGTMEWREFVPKEDPLRGALLTWHRSLGLLVFASVWLRLLLRATEPTPAIAPPLPAWQELPGRVMHWALYAMMIVLPVLPDGQRRGPHGQLLRPAAATPDRSGQRAGR